MIWTQRNPEPDTYYALIWVKCFVASLKIIFVGEFKVSVLLLLLVCYFCHWLIYFCRWVQSCVKVLLYKIITIIIVPFRVILFELTCWFRIICSCRFQNYFVAGMEIVLATGPDSSSQVENHLFKITISVAGPWRAVFYALGSAEILSFVFRAVQVNDNVVISQT